MKRNTSRLKRKPKRASLHSTLGGFIVKISTVLLFLGFIAGFPFNAISAFYILLTLITYLLYLIDKRAALKGRRRVSEKTLKLWSICGGWIGAYFGQVNFHHKVNKPAFIRAYWFGVFINVSALVSLTYGVIKSA